MPWSLSMFIAELIWFLGRFIFTLENVSCLVLADILDMTKIAYPYHKQILVYTERKDSSILSSKFITPSFRYLFHS